MLLSELFSMQNIECPPWLSQEPLEDDWKTSNYQINEDTHIWEAKTEVKNVKITFDGMDLIYEAFTQNNDLIYRKIINEDNIVQETLFPMTT